MLWRGVASRGGSVNDVSHMTGLSSHSEVISSSDEPSTELSNLEIFIINLCLLSV